MQAIVFKGVGEAAMMMMGLGTRGTASVTMADVEETRLGKALELGAHAAIHPDGLDTKRRFDVVIDCTGVPFVCERLPSFARDGATILFFGVCTPTVKVGLPPCEIFRRELTVVGSHSLSNNIPDPLSVLTGLGERAAALVSHRLPLEAIAERLRAPVKKGSIKIQFDAA